MRLLYSKPKLKDLSQGSRISFVRQIKQMSQDEVPDKLGLTGECKRRTMTRYERGNRNPKKDRTEELANIFNVNINSIKKYNFQNIDDVIQILLWLEEIIPNYHINLSDVPNINDKNILCLRKFINEWDLIKKKRIQREITYDQYINWKINYKVKELD